MTAALITGITGQDGSYLAELLVSKGYDVWGLVRKGKNRSGSNLESILAEIHFVQGDLSDQDSLDRAIRESRPDEVYNLAAQPDVALSWQQPVLTGEIDALGAIRLLEAVRRHRKEARVFQASSGEIFDRSAPAPQNEQTPFRPHSPYGAAKLHAFWATVMYRESHRISCGNGILFNHESPRRHPEYVTRKVSEGVARIASGLATDLHLGNLDAVRDWGFAGDYVEAMRLMLSREEADDYVIATGEAHSVREFVELAFREAGLDWQEYVVIDRDLFRPADPRILIGDCRKAREQLGWRPRVPFPDLVRLMVRADLERYGKGPGSGSTA